MVDIQPLGRIGFSCQDGWRTWKYIWTNLFWVWTTFQTNTVRLQVITHRWIYFCCNKCDLRLDPFFSFSKWVNIVFVGNIPRNALNFFFIILTCLAVSDPFCRQKWNFEGPKFLSKPKKTTFMFTLTIFLTVLIPKSQQKSTFINKFVSRTFVLIWDVQKVKIMF